MGYLLAPVIALALDQWSRSEQHLVRYRRLDHLITAIAVVRETCRESPNTPEETPISAPPDFLQTLGQSLSYCAFWVGFSLVVLFALNRLFSGHPRSFLEKAPVEMSFRSAPNANRVR